jgi:hypothetical protein
MFPLPVAIRFSICAVAGLLITILPAQADEKTGAVEGKVVFKGKPIADGKIVFHLDNGQFVGCKIKNGEYKIDRVPTGTRKVSIEANGIPAKFSSEETSALTVEIAGGRQQMNFELND